jgi:hypothetical protein
MHMAIEQRRLRLARNALKACSSDDWAIVRFGRPTDGDVEKGKSASFCFDDGSVSAIMCRTCFRDSYSMSREKGFHGTRQ